MLNDALIAVRFKIRMSRRYRNTFKIIFDILMGKYLSAGGLYKKFDLGNILLQVFGAITWFEIGEHKLFWNTYSFYRNIQQFADNQIENSIA